MFKPNSSSTSAFNGAGQVQLTASYRGDGKRAWKASSTSTRTYYLYDGDAVVCTLGENGTVTSVLTWGADGLVSRSVGTTSASSKFYLWDERGNGAQITSSTGAIIICLLVLPDKTSPLFFENPIHSLLNCAGHARTSG